MPQAAILNLSICTKMLKMYRPSADGFGLTAQKSFRINGKNKQTYFILKEQGRSVSFPDYVTKTWGGDVAQLIERQTGTPLT